MNSRKTINISNLIETANRLLLNSKDNMVSERHGIAMLVETLLHDTNNYNGFVMIDELGMEKSENGNIPGVRRHSEDKWENTDNSRIQFISYYNGHYRA